MPIPPNPSWSSIGDILAAALQELPARPEDELVWAGVQWELSVGRDLARVTRIVRLAPRTLFVEVDGAEWLHPLKSLEPRILESLNQRFGAGRFSRINYQAV